MNRLCHSTELSPGGHVVEGTPQGLADDTRHHNNMQPSTPSGGGRATEAELNVGKAII